MVQRTCSVDDCERPARSQVGICEWCDLHYERLRAHGDPLATKFFRGDPVARFWSYVDVRGPDECWPWTGPLSTAGYGDFFVVIRPRKRIGAHRFAYEVTTTEQIPPGLDLDHLCHTNDATCPGGVCMHRRCCNPTHVEPVSRSENVKRGHQHRRLTLHPRSR